MSAVGGWIIVVPAAYMYLSDYSLSYKHKQRGSFRSSFLFSLVPLGTFHFERQMIPAGLLDSQPDRQLYNFLFSPWLSAQLCQNNLQKPSESFNHCLMTNDAVLFTHWGLPSNTLQATQTWSTLFNIFFKRHFIHDTLCSQQTDQFANKLSSGCVLFVTLITSACVPAAKTWASLWWITTWLNNNRLGIYDKYIWDSEKGRVT